MNTFLNCIVDLSDIDHPFALISKLFTISASDQTAITSIAQTIARISPYQEFPGCLDLTRNPDGSWHVLEERSFPNLPKLETAVIYPKVAFEDLRAGSPRTVVLPEMTEDMLVRIPGITHISQFDRQIIGVELNRRMQPLIGGNALDEFMVDVSVPLDKTHFRAFGHVAFVPVGRRPVTIDELAFYNVDVTLDADAKHVVDVTMPIDKQLQAPFVADRGGDVPHRLRWFLNDHGTISFVGYDDKIGAFTNLPVAQFGNGLGTDFVTLSRKLAGQADNQACLDLYSTHSDQRFRYALNVEHTMLYLATVKGVFDEYLWSIK